MTIVADEGAVIDYGSLRMIPIRRLAVTAARLVTPADQVSFTEVGARTPPARGPHSGLHGFSEQAPLTAPLTVGVIKAATLAERALVLGQPVRPTVAAELGVSKSTVDRLLRQAKAQGLLENRSLPRRPSPQQRDTTAVAEHWMPKGLIEDEPLPKRPPPRQGDTTKETGSQ